MIKLEDLEVGQCYELEARNLQRGVWDGTHFHGIRYKFGQYFMDQEKHWDLCDKFGTANAVRRLL